MKNYYEILEVNEKASKEIIEKAYKVLIKKYHPDLYVGQERMDVEKKTRDLNEAYKILSDDFLREQYDTELDNERMMKYNRNFNDDFKYDKNNSSVDIEKNKNDNKSKIMKKFKYNENSQVGTVGSTIDLVKEIFQPKSKKISIKNIKNLDFKALGLTIAILIVLGIILWFIPFTNGFMRDLTVDNPLFSWIGKIFGK